MCGMWFAEVLFGGVVCNKLHCVHHTFLKLSDTGLFYMRWVRTVTKGPKKRQDVDLSSNGYLKGKK